jgi:hypothetical protein
MLIELLYVPGCPNRETALNRLKQVLQSQSLGVSIREIPVHDEAMARSLRFPGSPTIRVNTQDVEPEGVGGPAFACRLYSNGTGVPSEEAILHAVSAAKGENQRESN